MKLTLQSIAFLLMLVALPSTAQNDSFEEFRRKANADYGQFKQNAQREYENFRRKANEDYARFVEQAWKEYHGLAGRPVPEDGVKPVAPVVYPKDDADEDTPSPKPLPYDEVVTPPKPKPQPQPIAPVEPVKPVYSTMNFTFFGTNETIKFDKSKRLKLNGTDEQSIATVWRKMAEDDNYTTLISECLRIRSKRSLCDWAYLKMLESLGTAVYGADCADATLLTAFLYCQSGYKMRLAREGNSKLRMLIGSEHVVYNVSYYTINQQRFYAFDCDVDKLNICQATFPGERSMSLYVPAENQFDLAEDEASIRQSKRYPEVKTNVKVNVNLMSFYDTYPTSEANNNMMERWVMYANTPLANDVKQQLYPSLRNALKGESQLRAVNKLLNYVQTGFEYEYDDKVWGHDRAFFAEESLYYPYCDCEDRSILFTRLVRDLLGLHCILIYYPGHLAAAVEFTEAGVSGDWIKTNGHTFIVTDPTFIGAPVGRTMTGMDNSTAKVILLD